MAFFDFDKVTERSLVIHSITTLQYEHFSKIQGNPIMFNALQALVGTGTNITNTYIILYTDLSSGSVPKFMLYYCDSNNTVNPKNIISVDSTNNNRQINTLMDNSVMKTSLNKKLRNYIQMNDRIEPPFIIVYSPKKIQLYIPRLSTPNNIKPSAPVINNSRQPFPGAANAALPVLEEEKHTNAAPILSSINIRKPIINQSNNLHHIALIGPCDVKLKDTPKLSSYLDNTVETYKYTNFRELQNNSTSSNITEEIFREYLRGQLKTNPNKEYLIKSNDGSYYLKCTITNVCENNSNCLIVFITLHSNTTSHDVVLHSNTTSHDVITRVISLFELYQNNRFFEIAVNNTPAVIHQVPSDQPSVQSEIDSQIDTQIDRQIKFMEELQHGTNQSNGNHVGVFHKNDAEKVNKFLFRDQYFGVIYYYFTYEEAGWWKKIGSSLENNSNYEKIYSWRLIIVDRHWGHIWEIEIKPYKINGEFCMCIKDVKSLPDFMRKSLDNFIKTLHPDVIKKFSKIPVAILIKTLQPIGILPNIQLKGGKAKKTRVRRSKKSKRNTRRNTKRHRK